MPRVSPARRATGFDDEVAAILGPDDSRISAKSLAQQGVSAVLVGFLGLFTLAGVSTLSSPYSAAVPGATTAVVGSVDVTRAEPAATMPEAAGSSTTDNTPLPEVDDATRNADISRNSVRSELTKAVSEQLQQQRTDSLAQVQQQVATGAQNAANDSRAAALTGQNNAITGEQARRAEEARIAAEKAAAEKAAAEALAKEQAEAKAAASGTLKAPAATAKSSSTSTKSGSTDATAAAVAALPAGGCTTPMASYIRGAGFGQYGSWSRYHTGVDLSAPYGTPIRAVCDGIVLGQSGGGWAGINVAIAHPGGGATLYAHMSARLVQPGQSVKAGQIIGYVGLTGRTFGPHLHFEYYPNPSTIGDPYTASDPVSYMLRRGVRI